MKKTLSFIFIFLLALYFTGCKTFSPYPQVRGFYKEMPLEENCNIYFENSQGDLDIIGWKKNQIEIKAAKSGADSLLRQTDIEVKKKGGNLYIKTYPPRGDLRRFFVDFELRVPEKVLFKEIKMKNGNLNSMQIYGELRASIKKGNIKIEDFSGICEVFADEGYIAARIFENKKDDVLSFKTSDGDINLYLPSVPNVQITAETRVGNISSDFIPEEEKKESLKTWEQTLGQGDAKIKIKTWGGKIIIKKIQ
jgi:DUF4097 and DUF4098 domain-containing protein YvlB